MSYPYGLLLVTLLSIQRASATIGTTGTWTHAQRSKAAAGFGTPPLENETRWRPTRTKRRPLLPNRGRKANEIRTVAIRYV